MRILTVPRDQHTDQSDELAQMHRLRAIGFRGRLELGVTTSESGEFDQRDQLDPTNILAVANDNRVVVCARRLPAVDRTMSEPTFPQLLASGSLNATDRMIESFRVCIDTSFPGRGGGQFHLTALTVFAFIIELSMANCYAQIVTAKDLDFECTRNRPRWPITRLGEPVEIDNTIAICGTLPPDEASFEQVCPRDYH
ncbi:acyl-homoserine-lactone synthase (plasmid) [Agrobacterium tumefaciens]|uniref:acyl-homoserine-lactone synthase n=1 Tax=Agrobacterium tumefaciens TaxID=358 RepID=UPI0015736CFA|nr:acyl-homoserine-lactone synthase [Agrobacterium tumefaciens]NSZ66418.1 autoinducer synthesis protein [Agrobacterium tumefaciens]NTA72790.1 autoinducer synthesis protein [Agrobacterium tumefaciens]WIE41343.1 acyl-homoserine-lactone synthase [Agrobacterium tumefaciens]